jgi:hypothetical protein
MRFDGEFDWDLVGAVAVTESGQAPEVEDAKLNSP